MNPPLRTDADVAAVQGRAGRRHHRRHRHRPRAAHARRRRSARSTRRRRGCSASRPRSRSPSPSCEPAARREVLGAAVVAARPPSPASATTTAARSPPGRPANLCVHRPRRATWVVDARRAGQPQARNTPYAGRKLTGRVRHTLLRGEPVVRRRRGRSDDRPRSARRCSSSPTARRSRARRSAPTRRAASPPARSCSTPCSPATRRSSPTRPTPGRSSPSPTRTSATTASTADDDESRRPFCRGVVVRDLARRRSNWRADGDLDAFLAPPRRPRHRRHRHPPAHPPHPRRGRHARRVRHRRRGHAQGRRPPTSPAPTASTSSPTVTTRRALHGRRPGRRRVVAYDFGIKTHDPAPPRRASPPSRSSRRRRRPPTCSPASPTACSSRTAPATRPRSPYAVDAIARPARRGAGLRHLPRPPAPRPRRSAADTVQAAVRPPRRQPPGAPRWRPARSRSPARTTTTRSPPTRSPAAPRSPTSTSTTASSRACASRDAPAFSVQYHPEAGPGPHDAALPLRRVRRRSMDGQRADAASAPTSSRSCSSAVGPDRHRPGLRVRLLGHPGVPGAARRGLPGRPRQLEPGDDHDRPRLRRRHLRRAARRRRASTAIIERERPDALLPTLGGQTALNLAMELVRGGRARASTASS